MKKFIKEFLFWTGFVLFCVGVLLFVQEGLGYDLFTPVVIKYKLF